MEATSYNVRVDNKEKRTWDSFKEINLEKISKSDRKYEKWHKIIKVQKRFLSFNCSLKIQRPLDCHYAVNFICSPCRRCG